MSVRVDEATSHEIAHPKKRAMLAALSRTGNVSASARAADIARRTHYDWLESDPSYRPVVEEAMEEAVDVLEAVARQRALIGSDTLLIFLLKALRPERYRERYVLPEPVVEQVPERPETEEELWEYLDSLPMSVTRRMMEGCQESLRRRTAKRLEGPFASGEEEP